MILATASVLALGIAGSGHGNAADTYNSSPNTPGATTQSRTTTTMPQSTQAVKAPVDASESQVKRATERLTSARFYKGTADGKMGAEAKQAISEFQHQHGLTKTGTLDHDTLAASKFTGKTRPRDARDFMPAPPPNRTGQSPRGELGPESAQRCRQQHALQYGSVTIPRGKPRFPGCGRRIPDKRQTGWRSERDSNP